MTKTKLITRTPSAYEYPLLIKQLLHTPRYLAPDQEIVYRDLIRCTYQDFYQRVHRLAGALSGLGIGPGDTVAVLDWDSHRYLECFYAVPMLGAVLHTVNIRLSPEQMLYTMNHAEDKIVLVHEDFLPVMEELTGKLETVDSFVLIKDGPRPPATPVPLAGEYEDLLARASDHYEFPDFDENTQATMFYTTGTTGDPKGVYYSHRQLVLHTLTMGMTMSGFPRHPLKAGDVYMPITPMFHVHAWGIPYVATLFGVKQVYPGRYEPDLLLNLIEREGVTFSHCVPTILQMMLASPLAERVDLSNWTVNIGGAALTKGLARAIRDRGARVFAGYGMSETCPVLTVGALKPQMLDWDEERQIDVEIKAGFPVPLADVKVVDEAGRDLPRDGQSAGEIVVRTPWLTQGYFKDPERSEDLWAGGWLHTGDIAVIDHEGYFQITDRLKDVIKTGGEWVSSLQLESLISRYPAVGEVAVVGVPDEKWGERPLAMIVPAPDGGPNFPVEDLREFLMAYVEDGTIAKWALPDRIEIVAEIPKTSVGKMDKKIIRRQVRRDDG